MSEQSLPTKEVDHKGWGAFSTVILTVIIFFGAQIVAGIFFAILVSMQGWSEAEIQNTLDKNMAQFTFIVVTDLLILAVLSFVLRLKKLTFASLGLKWPTTKDASLALIGFLIYLIASAIATQIIRGIDYSQKQQLGFSDPQNIGELVFIGVSLVLLPPIIEELLCRGFLYRGLRGKFSAVVTALSISLIFAIAHLQIGSGEKLLWAAALDTFILSMVLVYLREKTKGLGAPILLHMYKNALAFTLIFIFPTA